MNLNFLNDLPEFNSYQPRKILENAHSTAFALGDDYLLTVFQSDSPLKFLLDNVDYFSAKGLIPKIITSGSSAGLDGNQYIISELTKGISLLDSTNTDQHQLAHALVNHLKEIQSINPEDLTMDKTSPIAFSDLIENIRTIISNQPCGNDQKVYTDILEQGLSETECPPGIVLGNINPQSIIVSDGKFAGFLTLPPISYGDSCFDLSIGYEYFDKDSRDEFFNLIGADLSIRKKSRNWALSKALTSMKDDEKSAMNTLYNIFEEYYS